jgi:hypothetical protein
MMNLTRSTAACLLAAGLAACGTAPEVAPVAAPATIHSVEQADQRLGAVVRERAAIAARFAAREQVCYEKFFVNHCLDEAKERRRIALATQRAIEIEAERYKRQAKVDERDRALEKADAEYQAEEARMIAEPPAPPQAGEVPPPRAGSAAGRIVQHKERAKQSAERERADAGKRAANVAAFEKRKAESEERQRTVEQRKAEKAAKAAKEAKDKEAAPANTQ